MRTIYDPPARMTVALGLTYFLVNRALETEKMSANFRVLIGSLYRHFVLIKQLKQMIGFFTETKLVFIAIAAICV